jgi:capsid assembly protease
MKLLDLLTAPWAILPDQLAEIQGIYATHLRGDKIDIAAIEARLGRPLAHEQQDYEVRQGGIAVLTLEGTMAPKANIFSQVSGGISTQMAGLQLESAGL